LGESFDSPQLKPVSITQRGISPDRLRQAGSLLVGLTKDLRRMRAPHNSTTELTLKHIKPAARNTPGSWLGSPKRAVPHARVRSVSLHPSRAKTVPNGMLDNRIHAGRTVSGGI